MRPRCATQGCRTLGQVRLRALTRVRLATAERTCEASGTPVICAPSPRFRGSQGHGSMRDAGQVTNNRADEWSNEQQNGRITILLSNNASVLLFGSTITDALHAFARPLWTALSGQSSNNRRRTVPVGDSRTRTGIPASAHPPRPGACPARTKTPPRHVHRPGASSNRSINSIAAQSISSCAAAAGDSRATVKSRRRSSNKAAAARARGAGETIAPALIA